MDVLFGSIDVRDLLSTHELEDSSPLSAPDLRLLIDRLQIRSLHIKDKVRDYILSHRTDFSEIFNLCSESALKSEDVGNQIRDVVRMISDSPVDVEIREIVDGIRRSVKEVKEKKEVLDLVSVIVDLTERLSGVREEVRMGRLIAAATSVRDLKVALRISGDGRAVEEGGPVVFDFLRKEWHKCFEEIQEVLVRLMENAVHFEKESSRLRVRYRPGVDGIDGVDLHIVLTAMDVVGVLDYGLAKVSNLMIKYVISPIVYGEFLVSFVEESNFHESSRDSEQATEAILKIVQSSGPKSEKLNGEAIYSGISQALKFIYNSIFFENGPWMRSFGRLTWPSISELLISNFLSKVVPTDASKLGDFQKIVNLSSDFENSLKEIMFISSSDNKDERLSNFAENVEGHFASKKKIEILANARNLLVRCDFVHLQEHTRKYPRLNNDGSEEKYSDQVVNLLFLSKKCVVSEAASQLMELVHQTLQDVCVSSARVALEFYRAARDALLLYEAIIPVKLERQLDGINQASIAMHNDCLYLSQEILGLAFQYRPSLPGSIKEHAMFVDMAPRFCLMAEEILQRQIQLVIFNLREAIDGADGFQNTHQIKQFESAKFSIDQVVFILEKVHIIWEPLLLPSTYKSSMCMVLESVFSRMTKDVLLLDDMAAEETLQLQRLIHLMLESLTSLMESLIFINQEEKSQESFPSTIDDLIPSLRKIRKLADLLDMPLRSITTLWESGELGSCGFTLSEMEDFIRAIFADSPLRKECLWRIRSANF